MNFSPKREPVILLLGDIVSCFLSLWVMLLVRYTSVPSAEAWYQHAIPFSILFVVWLVVFFIAGMYEKHTLILKNRISATILNAQVINSVLAVMFFYLIPYFGITPKTNLFIYLLISFAVILGWRTYVFSIVEKQKRQKAILIGSGDEMLELEREVNNNNRYNLEFVSSVDADAMENMDFESEILSRIYAEGVFIVAVDFKNEKIEPLLPKLYNLIFSGVKFIDMHKIYEDIFDRIPLSLVKYSWFLENISVSTQKGYDLVKRLMDVILALVLGMLSLIFYPFVFVAVKLEDQGPIFFTQERLGQNNKIIKIIKFRSLGYHDNRDGIADAPKQTRAGKILRKTRVDELPQLWNVLKGDLSMIGPRPEIPTLVRQYEKEIPYYNVRHLIKPGLSGWAQLYGEHAHHSGDVSKTKNKLSYDLYYIKNRSLLLDLKIALRTLKVIISKEGI